MSLHISWQPHAVDKMSRAALKHQRPCLLWFTGLSGSGKSTISGLTEQYLAAAGFHTYLLDGDNIRHGLCNDLGFSADDRRENVRRVAEVGKLMTDAGLIVLTALISPFRTDRDAACSLFPNGEFIEVFVDTPLEECERRDPKGLYAKARAGKIPNFTGINSEYQAPLQPAVHLQTLRYSAKDCAMQLIDYLCEAGFIEAGRFRHLSASDVEALV